MPVHDIDVAIIGAGTAGLSARSEVAKRTDNYRVFDPGPLGTTCARVGCMPSKAFVQSAYDFHRRFHFDQLGIIGAGGLSARGGAILAEARLLRDRFVAGVLKDMEPWRKTHLVPHAPRFTPEGTLSAGQREFRAGATIIATGTRPLVPSDWRAACGDRILTTDDFFELEDLPRRIAIVGLGPIGLELGQALGRLGVEVTGFDLSRNLGGVSDPALLDRVIEAMRSEFRIVFSAAKPVRGPGGVSMKWEGGETMVDYVLVAIGRQPNLGDLGLEQIGLELCKNGRPELDETRLKVPGHEIYLAGDVTGLRPLLHEAADEGRIAGYNAVRGEDAQFRRRTQMRITFTDPQIAEIGESWRDLASREAEIAVGAASFQAQGRALLARTAAGAIRVYAEKSTAKLLGVAMFAPAAEHMAHLFAYALEQRATLPELLRTPFYHPTYEEALRTALRGALAESVVKAQPLEEIRCEDAPVEAGLACD
ncbi:dihydrolipoyl dehydrogenase [Methylocystis echinoides]|uniref:dihydrolipoyl dehydrogenase n=1 Tax=Methylocystis echinoides TaxID=29468 RepID=UPI00343F85C4